MQFEKIQKGWKELEEEIINTGKCVYCGACSTFCENINFDFEREIPIEDGSCKDVNTCRDGFGVCYNLCPKTGIDFYPISLLDKWVFGKEQNSILGHYIEIVSVRLTDTAKKDIPETGGSITALLYAAMDKDLIDCVITTRKNENFRPIPFIVKNKQDLFNGMGYEPSQSPTLSIVEDAINQEFSDIAVVGNGCQIQALRKIQNHPRFDFEAFDLVSLAIGTFCFGTFHNLQLTECFKEYKINPSEIEKIETDKNNFKMVISTKSGKKEIPLNYLYDKAIKKACFSCSDYTASFADISVSDMGSEDGWNTLIIRNQRGKKVFDLAVSSGLIETKSLEREDEEIVLEITRNKTDIVKIESVVEYSPEIKSFIVRNERIAKAYRPGQFVVLWLPDVDFLPMSISNVDGNLVEITVQKIGEGTEKLLHMKEGDTIGIRGPYGNSWFYEDASNVLIIGGGMGIAALTSVIESLKKNNKNIFAAFGAKDKSSLIFGDRITLQIPNTQYTTDDGSIGKKCFVTDIIEDIIDKNDIDLILTCGPEVMMKRVLEIAELKKINIQASLERKMKCGVGLCGSCCIGEENNVSVCKDGPIFDSTQLRKFPKFGTYSK